MADLTGNVVTADEVRHFYEDYPNNWFLLEIVKEDEHGKAERMRVVGHDKDKEVLREQVFEELDRVHGKFIFVYANSDGTCNLG